VKVDVVIMPLLVTPRSLSRVADQQKLFHYDQQQLFTQIMSKCGPANGQEESHSYDNRGADEGN
jgi:hypothetical protein